MVLNEIRVAMAMKLTMAAYRAGDYEQGLKTTEGLKGETRVYCYMKGSMLWHLGRLAESEASLREGLPLEKDSRSISLVCNTLASVLLDQQRYAESIEFYETAGRLWPDRGANLRGVAEVWLRQGKELKLALEKALQAADIDRQACSTTIGMNKEVLDERLGEDLAVLAWAVAANSGTAKEVESLLSQAYPLCGNRSKPVTGMLHYHIGRAYLALNVAEKSREHFHLAVDSDPNGPAARLAQAVTS